MEGENIGFVYQFHHLMPELNVLDNVALPLRIHGYGAKKSRLKAIEVLKEINLDAFSMENIAVLSGGERQRVAFARAIVHGPRLLFADEMTSHLDHKSRDELFVYISKWMQNNNSAVILVTHDLDLASKCSKLLFK